MGPTISVATAIYESEFFSFAGAAGTVFSTAQSCPCRHRPRRGRNRQSRPRKRGRHSRCRSWQRASKLLPYLNEMPSACMRWVVSSARAHAIFLNFGSLDLFLWVLAQKFHDARFTKEVFKIHDCFCQSFLQRRDGLPTKQI